MRIASKQYAPYFVAVYAYSTRAIGLFYGEFVNLWRFVTQCATY